LRDQCAAAGVPFFFKQWGEWAPGENSDRAQTKTERTASWSGDTWTFENITASYSQEMHADDEPDLWRLGKKQAGRLLDARTHDEFPQVDGSSP
jgi:protein gp37